MSIVKITAISQKDIKIKKQEKRESSLGNKTGPTATQSTIHRITILIKKSASLIINSPFCIIIIS